MEQDIRVLQKDIAKLEVKIEHLEKKDFELSQNVKDLEKNLDTRFNEFEEKMESKLNNMLQLLTKIEHIVIEAKGAKKLVTTTVASFAVIGSLITFVYQFLK